MPQFRENSPHLFKADSTHYPIVEHILVLRRSQLITNQLSKPKKFITNIQENNIYAN
jgi:hypothetical protein